MTEKRRPEPTLPGNPFKLTVQQHVHSRACIERFYDEKGRVFVQRLTAPPAPPFPASADNPIFCAMRVWDQGSEANFFRSIEDTFQDEVDKIIARGSVRKHSAITEYFVIWSIRAALDATPPEDIALNGVSGWPLTKEQEERLESKHVSYARGGVMPGRLTARLQILRSFDLSMSERKQWRWGLVTFVAEPQRGNLICPDVPPSWPCIPISPSSALIAGIADRCMGPSAIHVINAQLRADARRFVFGHPSGMGG